MYLSLVPGIATTMIYRSCFQFKIKGLSMSFVPFYKYVYMVSTIGVKKGP